MMVFPNYLLLLAVRSLQSQTQQEKKGSSVSTNDRILYSSLKVVDSDVTVTALEESIATPRSTPPFLYDLRSHLVSDAAGFPSAELCYSTELDLPISCLLFYLDSRHK